MPSHPIDVRPFVFALLLVPSLGCSAIVGYPCEQGYVSCDGQCVAVASDPEHCGGCDIVCGSHVCAGGVCVPEGDAQLGDASAVRDAGVGGDGSAMIAEAGPGFDSSVLGDGDGGTSGDPDAGVAGDDSGLDVGSMSGDPDASTSGDDAGTSGDDAGTTGDDAGTSDDASMPDPDGGTVVCDIGELSCDGVCVTAGSDAQNCGACGVICPGDMSCSDGVCVLACDPSELRCDRGCVDPTSDPNHCGGCDIQCATGICVDSACVSGYAGHLVMIGHDYSDARPAEDLVLAHAIALGAARSPRVLRYVGDAAPDVAVTLNGALARLGIAYVEVTDDGEVPLRLASADVFLVDAQHDADDGTLTTIGTEWSRALDSFLGRGGVVVALDAIAVDRRSSGAVGWMSAAGLVDPCTRSDAFGEVVRVVAPSDGLVIGVPLSFRASASSVQWAAPSLPIVVAGDSGGVVLHRTVLPM